MREQDIRQYVGDTAFQRGRPYVSDGSLFSTRREGFTFKARCHGRSGGPYLVDATLATSTGAAVVERSLCSCPVGYDGRCKHVAALLLRCLEHPDDFIPIESADASLGRRSKEELITLIKLMLLKEPDLELLLETPVAASPGGAAVDPAPYRRQVRRALRGGRDEWGASYGIAGEIRSVTMIADGFAARGDWRNAATIYDAIAAEVLEEADEIQDEEGEIGTTVADCATGLGRCLVKLTGPAEREPVLRSLFEILQGDMLAGGMGMDGDAQRSLIEETSPEERQMVAAWALAAMPAKRENETYRDWTRGAFGSLVIALEGEMLDDERYLAIVRQAGLNEALIERLLLRDRLREALDEAEAVSDYEVVPIATMLVKYDHSAEAEAFVERRSLRGLHRASMRGWLRGQYEQRGSLPAALEIAREDFLEAPSQPGFSVMRRLAELLGRWEQERALLVAEVVRRGSHGLLVALHLDEGSVDAAVEVWPRVQRPAYGLRLRLAQACEAAHPAMSLALYEEEIEALVAGRNRNSYAEAAQLLLKLRTMLTTSEGQAICEAYFNDFIARHRGLPALKDEARKAGLSVS